jgi:hypothetical protein
MIKYTVFLATCTSSMDTINTYLGLFSVHYQLKINFKADFSRSESHYLPMTLLNISIQTCLYIIITFINHSKKKVVFLFYNENLSRSVYYLYFVVFLGILGKCMSPLNRRHRCKGVTSNTYVHKL